MFKPILIIFTYFIILFNSIKAQTSCMEIGVGLSGPSYYENGENPFIDQVKWRGPWFTFPVNNSTFNSNLIQEIALDSKGNPMQGIPQATSGGLQKIRFMLSANGRMPLGKYVLTYKGYAKLSFGGIQIDSIKPGRLVVTCNSLNNVWVNIDSTAPAPNQIQDMHIVPYAQEFSYNTDVFRAEFINKLKPFYCIRFMDWFHTNGNTNNTWNQRVKADSIIQTSERGIAYEYAIDLCNRAQKNLWVNIPHLADSNYIAQMALLFHNLLNKNSKIYLEYSNEIWNFAFTQTQWINQSSKYYPNNWPKNELYDSTKSAAFNSGKLCERAFRIWRNTWATDSSRIIRVLTCQAANSYIAAQNVLGCHHQYDALSPSWYFGLSPNQIKSLDSTATSTQLIDSCRINFFKNTIKNIKDHYTIAANDHKYIVHYEGGQSITAEGNSKDPLLNAMYDAQVNPAMYTLYDNILDSLRTWGSKLSMAYVLAGGNSIYGSWGHILKVDSVHSKLKFPKFEALLDNLPAAVNCNSGINKSLEFNDKSFTVYPNPNSGYMRIQSEVNTIIKSIQIVDMNASILYQLNSNDSEVELNLENFSAGFYVLKIIDAENKYYHFKIIKQ